MRRGVVVALVGLGLGALCLALGFATLPRELCATGPDAAPCDRGWGNAAFALVGLGVLLVAASAIALALLLTSRKA